jgi:hypothetical protein
MVPFDAISYLTSSKFCMLAFSVKGCPSNLNETGCSSNFVSFNVPFVLRREAITEMFSIG